MLDNRLQFKPDPRQRDIVCLCTQGIGLAAEFLREKIEFAPDRPALGKEGSGRLHMRSKPVELLADISARRDENRLLMKPIGIEPGLAIDQLGDLGFQTGPDGIGLARRRGFRLVDEGRQPTRVAAKDRGERLPSLKRMALKELGQRGRRRP